MNTYDVGDNVTVQVGHNHNIELLRTRNKLHSSVINDHIIDFEVVMSIFLCDITTSTQEKTISQFPIQLIKNSVLPFQTIRTLNQTYIMLAL
jgi:hypothetical protein